MSLDKKEGFSIVSVEKNQQFHASQGGILMARIYPAELDAQPSFHGSAGEKLSTRRFRRSTINIRSFTRSAG